MNNDNWIKLWENTIYNPIWRNDPVAWKIFEYLLISSYRGKPQGTTSKTLQQIADTTGVKNGTVFSAVRRLIFAGMIETKSTNKKTDFQIVNWWIYQGKSSSGKNQAKTKQKPSKTLIRIKNKELNNSNVEAQRAFDLYIDLFNKNPNQTKLTKARLEKLKLRIKQNGSEQLEAAIRNTAASDFHRGNNDRGWSADLDFIIRNQEQVERLSQLKQPIAAKRAPVVHDRTPERKLTKEEYDLARAKADKVRQQLVDHGIL